MATRYELTLTRVIDASPEKLWNEEDHKAHEAMGFHEGWGKAADQLSTSSQRSDFNH